VAVDPGLNPTMTDGPAVERYGDFANAWGT
jgi:hypothetical protein